jgi:hypothetical protein
LHGRNELLSQPIVDAFSPNPFLPEDPRSEAAIFLKNFCATNSSSPEVELRFCLLDHSVQILNFSMSLLCVYASRGAA